MAFLLPTIQAISGALGIFTGVKSIIGGSEKKSSAPDPAPTPKPLPAQPSLDDSKKKAEDQVARRRRINLLSGGQTNINEIAQGILGLSPVNVNAIIVFIAKFINLIYVR